MGTVSQLGAHARGGASPDAVLVAAARAGEGWAAEALFRRHAKMANGLAFRLLGSDQERDDVVQDAYVIALDRLATLENPQAFGPFLAGIIVLRVRRVVRRRALARRFGLLPRSEPLDVSALVSPTAPADVVAELTAVYRIVDDLPTDERLALILRRVEGLQLEEVAAACACSLATAKRRIAAAEAKLGAVLTRAPRVVAPRPRAVAGEKP